MQTCIACNTEDTAACWLEWQAAPADAARVSATVDNRSEARSPLMLMFTVLGRLSSEHIGPFTFRTSCISSTQDVGFVDISWQQKGSDPIKYLR